jgi:hypothetical protein
MDHQLRDRAGGRIHHLSCDQYDEPPLACREGGTKQAQQQDQRQSEAARRPERPARDRQEQSFTPL